MSVWWDPHAERYRSTLPHKCVFGFGWPAVRWVMFNCMACETAHHLGIRSLRWFGWVDDAWSWGTLVPKLLWLFGVQLWVLYAYMWFWERTGLLMVGPKRPVWVE